MSGNQPNEISSKLNTIEEAIDDIKAGKVIIVVDDEDRENEGDFIAAASMVTPEMINFMATHGRGLICAPLIEDRCEQLGLELMVQTNNAAYETPFTVSVDLIGHGCTTGISASDRSKTVKALINPATRPEELGKPGHIFPLKAKRGGVLRRAGHTEASIDLARLAGLDPAGVIVEICNEDGSMARMPDLIQIAERFDLKLITIKDLIAYRIKRESLIKRSIELKYESKYGDFDLITYEQVTSGEVHFALIKGNWTEDDPVMVRVQSSNAQLDMLAALKKDYVSPIDESLKMIAENKSGILLYMAQNSNAEAITKQLKAYKLQQKGISQEEIYLTLNLKMDNKDYGVGAQILRDLDVSKINLISNKAQKRSAIDGYSLDIVDTTPINYNKK
jgi:3,4-dihydroxy 2-butanone 4-phosphate synthase / GTP cyclohydrolase II